MELFVNYGIRASSLSALPFQTTFFSVPGQTSTSTNIGGHIRLKLDSDAPQVMVRYKTSPFTSSVLDGTLLDVYTDFTHFSGPNNFVHVQGLTNNTLYYFRVIPAIQQGTLTLTSPQTFTTWYNSLSARDPWSTQINDSASSTSELTLIPSGARHLILSQEFMRVAFYNNNNNTVANYYTTDPAFTRFQVAFDRYPRTQITIPPTATKFAVHTHNLYSDSFGTITNSRTGNTNMTYRFATPVIVEADYVLDQAVTTQLKSGGLFLEYTMDSNSILPNGTTMLSSVQSTNRQATLFNSPTFQEGVIGNAVFGNGTNAYISRDGNFGLTSGRTIVAWINTGTVTNSIYLDYYGSDQYTLWRRSGSEFRVEAEAANTSISITDNQWLFVCARNTGTSFKVNFNAGPTQTFTANSFTSSSFFKLLSDYTGASNFTNGAIDTFRIYGRELEDYEIANLYQEGSGIVVPPPASPGALVVYDAGAETSAFGGFNTLSWRNVVTTNQGFTKNSDHILLQVQGTSASNGYALLTTDNAVDVTNYTTLRFTGNRVQGAGSVEGTTVGLYNLKISGPTTDLNVTAATPIISSSSTIVVESDISAVTGLQYIRLRVWDQWENGGNGLVINRIDKIELLP
jgi:hypothetical protein